MEIIASHVGRAPSPASGPTNVGRAPSPAPGPLARPILSVLAGLVCFTASLNAVETKYWSQSEMADFEKATLTKISVSSEGHLSLAPRLTEIFDASVTYLWAVARDSKGNLYTGGGGLGATKAKLFQLDAQGHSKTIAE